MTEPMSGADPWAEVSETGPWTPVVDWRSRVPASVTDDLTPAGDEVHTTTDRRMLWHLRLALTHAPIGSYLAEKGETLHAYLNETCGHHWQRWPGDDQIAAHRQCLWCCTVEWEDVETDDRRTT